MMPSTYFNWADSLYRNSLYMALCIIAVIVYPIIKLFPAKSLIIMLKHLSVDCSTQSPSHARVCPQSSPLIILFVSKYYNIVQNIDETLGGRQTIHAISCY
jgi:hypothetical protein